MLNKSLWKRLAAAGLALMMVLSISACGAKKTDDAAGGSAGQPGVQSEQQGGEQAQQGEPGQEEEQAPEQTPEEQEVTAQGEAQADGTYSYNVKLSFANYNYIDTGDANEPKMFRNISASLEMKDDSLESLMAGIIDALHTVPAGVENAETMVSDIFAVNSVTLDKGTAIVDISGAEIEGASMFDEEYFIYQVADSLLHSISGLTAVQFIIDGDQSREMMYMDISKAFTLSDCDAFAGK